MISQTLLDALPLGVLVTDGQLRLVQLNSWLGRRLSPGQLARVGEPLGAVFPELYEHNLLAAFKLVLQQGQPVSLSTSVHRYVVRLPVPPGVDLPEMAQSVTIVPLFEGGALTGTLTLIQDVSQAVAAERTLERKIDRLNALHEIDRALATLDLPACLQVIVDRTHQLFGGEMVALFLREGDRLRVAAGAGFEFAVVDRSLRTDEGVIGWVATQRTAALIGDVRLDPRYLAVEPETCAEMAVPLNLHDDCLGVINVESRRVNAFVDDDLEMLEMLGARAAIAIHNARLHAAERQQHQLAVMIQEIGLRLATELDPEAILDTLLDQVVRVVPYDSASVLMLDGTGQKMWVERHRGYEKFGVTEVVTHFRTEMAAVKNLARMAASRRPFVIPHVLGDPDWVPAPSSAHIRSWAGAPILARGRVLGFLSLDKIESGYYSAALAERLAAFAAQAGLALENAHLYAEQQQLAVTDGLTGVGNRRHFDGALTRELQRAARFLHSTALLMIDLDDFKQYNDRFGHLAGDELLRAVALALSQCLRLADTVARYGGEEFVIILPETDLEAASAAAERVRLLIEHLPLRPGPAEAAPVTVSLGVSAAPLHAVTVTELVHAADVALYQAKKRGKNRVVVYDNALAIDAGAVAPDVAG